MSVDNGPAESDPICKKNESQETNITNHSTSISKVPPISVGKGANSDEDDGISSELKTDDDDAPFDVFSHAAILEDPSEKDAYELKRMWDAWAEQISWARSGIELEQSCGVSRNVILDFYRAELYPRRADLLKSLADAVQMPRSGEKDPRSLHETPLAPILMSHFGTAASVMNAR
jgi:hypothetical protein